MRKEANKVEPWQLAQRQSHPLQIKEKMSLARIRAWYERWEGQVYVAFSGGKDSTVLLDLVRREYPKVPAVFVDTGLEFPEIREFVRSIDNVVWLKPKIPFPQVIEKHGYPVVSKRQAQYIGEVQRAKGETATKRLRLTGIKSDGTFSPMGKIPDKWHSLALGNIPISDKCCNVMKKEPMDRYVAETGRMPLIGTMAADSNQRQLMYLKNGCNLIDTKRPRSTPLAFWLEHDIWEYLKTHDVPYSTIYDMGYERTGCMFCMFGVHMEKGENRFQRMARTHPKQYRYCIDILGCGKVLDAIGVDYKMRYPLFESENGAS